MPSAARPAACAVRGLLGLRDGRAGRRLVRGAGSDIPPIEENFPRPPTHARPPPSHSRSSATPFVKPLRFGLPPGERRPEASRLRFPLTSPLVTRHPSTRCSCLARNADLLCASARNAAPVVGGGSLSPSRRVVCECVCLSPGDADAGGKVEGGTVRKKNYAPLPLGRLTHGSHHFRRSDRERRESAQSLVPRIKAVVALSPALSPPPRGRQRGPCAVLSGSANSALRSGCTRSGLRGHTTRRSTPSLSFLFPISPIPRSFVRAPACSPYRSAGLAAIDRATRDFPLPSRRQLPLRRQAQPVARPPHSRQATAASPLFYSAS